jgi:hypothetical protein
MVRKQGHEAWTRYMDMQQGPDALACRMDMDDGQAVWKNIKNMQHGHATWTLRTFSMDVQQEQSAWTCSTDI